jgi:drug/metabolite transporter (DMT)-like permease
MVEFISIVVLTFALALIVLGAVTMWLERGRGRLQGIALTLVGLLVGAGYAFLGSRFSLTLLDRLVVRVDLPALMATAFTYTAGVLGGSGLAVGLFLWATGRFRHRVERTMAAFVAAGVLVAVVGTLLAVALSAP